MKTKITFLIVSILLVLNGTALLAAGVVAVTNIGVDIKEPSPWWIPIATSIYGIIVRVIPTIKDYTILGKVFKWLKKASDFFNIIKQGN